MLGQSQGRSIHSPTDFTETIDVPAPASLQLPAPPLTEALQRTLLLSLPAPGYCHCDAAGQLEWSPAAALFINQYQHQNGLPAPAAFGSGNPSLGHLAAIRERDARYCGIIQTESEDLSLQLEREMHAAGALHTAARALLARTLTSAGAILSLVAPSRVAQPR